MRYLFVIFFNICILGQSVKVTRVFNYEGIIGEYPVCLKFPLEQGDKDSISAQYYYKSKGFGNKIYLEGLQKNNRYFFTEVNYTSGNKKITGTFILEENLDKLTGHWNNSSKTKELPVELKLIENSNFLLKHYRFILATYKGKCQGYSTDNVDCIKANRLKIYNDDKTLIQEIGDFDVALSEDNGEIELEDMNFDGYLDLKIGKNHPERIKYDFTWVHYLYIPKLKKWVRNKALDELEYVDVNPEKKEVIKYEADGSGNESDYYYIWQNDRLFLKSQENVYENDAYTHHTEYKIINGKSVIVKKYKTK